MYSGLYVNEGADSGNPEQMDQIAREKVCFNYIYIHNKEYLCIFKINNY